MSRTPITSKEIADFLLKQSIKKISKIFVKIAATDLYFMQEVAKVASNAIIPNTKPALRQVGKTYEWRYCDCKADSNGFVNVNNSRPLAYDMTIMKVKRAGKILPYCYSGWWTGKTWESLKLKEDDEVISWKLEPGGN